MNARALPRRHGVPEGVMAGLDEALALLQPFAGLYHPLMDSMPDDRLLEVAVTVGDIRAARRFLDERWPGAPTSSGDIDLTH